MENIIQLITSLFGGGANNSLLIVGAIVAVIFFITQKKNPPTPKPDIPAKGEMQAGLLDLLNIDAGNMPILAWFAALPADQQAAFWSAVMKKIGTLK